MNMTKTPSLLVVCLFLVLGCSSKINSEVSAGSKSTSGQSVAKCSTPQGVSGRPATIEDVVTLINSLPQPVTVSCFLESLERPLNVTLTNSQMSAQPAVGSRSPRVFILNDKLYMSIVPEGFGRDFLELSYQTSTTTSIKAQIEFPIMQPISKSKPYDDVRFGSQTRCSSCHRAETQVGVIDGVPLFESWAFQPDKETLVDLRQFKSELSVCNFDKEPERCEIIRALLNNGEVNTQSFPKSMFFNFSIW